MGSKRFEDVRVWQKAHEFVIGAYQFSCGFPQSEMFGLTSQLRRAAVSVPANFAEGFKKRAPREKARLYNIAQASLEECRYYLLLSESLGYGNTTKLKALLEEVSSLLESYRQAMLNAEC